MGRETLMVNTTHYDMFDTEQRRLAALRSLDILDTAPEEAYDRIAKLAQDLFDLPIALITLIDDKRQWFKSRFGLSIHETPRSWAFCNHAIRQSEPLVVPDARLDSRFSDNPLVVGDPKIRFYAGAPILTPDGLALGTVCVLSTEPRAGFSADDARRLNSLAGIVASEMELRRHLARARRHVMEKDTLIREVHHEVANGLQIVAYVLELQANAARNAEARLALTDSVARVIAIGAVHQQLRRAADPTAASARSYLDQITDRLWRAAAPLQASGSIVTEVPADLMLDGGVLGRLGMTVSVLVIHAFRAGARQLTVTVAVDAGWIVLTVEHDGAVPPIHLDRGAEDDMLLLPRLLAGEENITLDPADQRRIVARFAA